MTSRVPVTVRTYEIQDHVLPVLEDDARKDPYPLLRPWCSMATTSTATSTTTSGSLMKTASSMLAVRARPRDTAIADFICPTPKIGGPSEKPW
jgi:hypothetical protein